MIDDQFEKIRAEIASHDMNKEYIKAGYEPLFAAAPDSKIIIVGQAPGIRAQTSGIPWDDKSGPSFAIHLCLHIFRWIFITQEKGSREIYHLEKTLLINGTKN